MLVSHLGLGTWRWGSETDEDDAADQLIAFHEAGGTLVDTGTSYSAGRSEEILGRLLGDVIPREELVIATKARPALAGRAGHDRCVSRRVAAPAGPVVAAIGH